MTRKCASILTFTIPVQQKDILHTIPIVIGFDLKQLRKLREDETFNEFQDKILPNTILTVSVDNHWNLGQNLT